MAASNRIRILLADDHLVVRSGLRALLAELPEVEIVGEANTGVEAVESARALAPQVVLMDISMRDLNGIDATARIRRDMPGTRVLMLSMHASEEYVVQALRAGASGYLLKDSTPEELSLAVQAAARGETYLSPRVARPMIEAAVQQPGQPGTAAAALTDRQRQVLQMMAEGHSVKEIAYRLGLSVKTVETHRAQIMKRLAIRDLPGLVRYAIRAGLVASDH